MSGTYLSFQLNMLKRVGLWNDMQTPRHHKTYYILTMAFLLPMIIHVICGSIDLIVSAEDNQLTYVNIILTLIGCIVKTWVFVRNHQNISDIVAKINQRVKGDRAKELHDRCEKRSKQILITFISTAIIGSLSFQLASILPSYNFVNGSKRLALRAWYPFDKEKYFGFAVLLQVLLNISTCFTTPMIDIFLPSLLMHLAGQLEVVNITLSDMTEIVEKKTQEENARRKRISQKNLREMLTITGYNDEMPADDMERNHSHKLESILEERVDTRLSMEVAVVEGDKPKSPEIIGNPKNTKDAGKDTHLLPPNEEDLSYRLLIRCAQHHEEILSLVRDVQKVFSPIIFIQMLTNSGVICLVTVQVSQIETLNFEFLAHFLYFTVSIAQIFMFCAFGTYLTSRGEEMAGVAYNVQWYQLSARFNYALRLIIHRAQQPIVLVGERFYDLSLERFAAILTASVSYYSVLTQVIHGK